MIVSHRQVSNDSLEYTVRSYPVDMAVFCQLGRVLPPHRPLREAYAPEEV